MNQRLVLGGLVVAGLAGLILLTPSTPVESQEIRRVLVTNFPHPQQIEGEVSIDGPVRLSELRSFEEIVVPPVKLSETTRLVEAGTLVTDGFPNVVLSLHGVVRGSVLQPGEIGAILIPDQETIQEAFNEQGLMHFALQAVAGDVSAKTPYFASNQPRYTVGFHTYRVLLYNTTDKTVTTNLFAYLTN